MLINTASSAIRFSRELGEASAQFYEEVARLYENDAEILNGFAKENRKTNADIERSYYSVITDAIEGCYAFNMDTDNYEINTTLDDASYQDALKQVLENERALIRFYSDAEEQSRATLADIPVAFRMVVKKRNERVAKLQSMVNAAA